MRFFIVDDDEAVRSSLAQLIEDEELGIVAGEAEDGAELTASYLNDLHIDILCIDLLMPERAGSWKRSIAMIVSGSTASSLLTDQLPLCTSKCK